MNTPARRQVLTAITGATISSIIMAMVLLGGIALMAASESQHFYMRGFQTASLAVVGIMIAGAIIVAFHRVYDPDKNPSREQASPAVADDSAGDYRSTRKSPSETTGAFHLGQITDSRPYPDRFNGSKTPVSGT